MHGLSARAGASGSIADAVLEQPGDSASQPEQQPELGAALASEATSQQNV